MKQAHRLALLPSLATLFSTLAAIGMAYATDTAEAPGKLLFYCHLDKSNTLNVYRDTTEMKDTVTFQVKNFLGSGETVLVMRHPHIVEYGNVFIALENAGRSGYALLRFEMGNKPSIEEDVGDSTVLLDNNLFLDHENRIFTGGKLRRIQDCVAAQD